MNRHWNSYLETLNSWGPDQKTSRSMTDSCEGQLKPVAVSDAPHNDAYIEGQLAKRGREALKSLRSFPFVITAVIIVTLVFVSNVLKIMVL